MCVCVSECVRVYAFLRESAWPGVKSCLALVTALCMCVVIVVVAVYVCGDSDGGCVCVW